MLNASTGISIRLPICRQGKPSVFTSSYAFGNEIPISSAKSCTLIVDLFIVSSFLLHNNTATHRWRLIELFEHYRRVASGTDLPDSVVGGKVFCTIPIAPVKCCFFMLCAAIGSLLFSAFHVYASQNKNTPGCPVTGNSPRVDVRKAGKDILTLLTLLYHDMLSMSTPNHTKCYNCFHFCKTICFCVRLFA